MNKKVNTILFVLGATLFNVLVTVLCLVLLVLIFARFIAPYISDTAQAWGFSLIFIAAIAGSFFTYRALLKFLMVKFDFEKYFDPIFRKG